MEAGVAWGVNVLEQHSYFGVPFVHLELFFAFFFILGLEKSFIWILYNLKRSPLPT